MSRNKNVSKLISDTVHLCSEHGVAFKLIQKSKVPLGNNLFCNGYFWADTNKLEFVVATKKPIKDWIQIFVHESCHLDQYIKDKTKFINDDGTSDIDKWLLGENIITKPKVKRLIKIVQRLELDCEKRSVAKIKKYKLPINIDEYIQKSNLYVHFHNWMYLRRSWIPKGKTLYVKELYSMMNKTFDKSYAQTPKKIIEALDNHLLKK